MCGIAGLVDWSGRLGRDRIAAIARAMADAMPYRGPDDQGLWVSPDGRCALSHRRLSIIDTSAGGHQPFVGVGVGERHALTFNGEIYNYRELRAELLERGERFRTQSDTEVLLALLAHDGEEAIEQLDGQFAFGLWDTGARELLLARDPFGEKPLYFAEGDGWFAFASELHALAQVPGLDTGVDADTVAEYLALQYVDAPRTIWRGAKKLKPGHWLRLRSDGRVTIGRHFAFRPDGDVRCAAPLSELADELEDILLRLVRRRMISDVPLGAFLSGGVDSSTVVALMTRLGSAVRTFSIGFAGAPDESEHLFARATAQHLGTQHCEQVLELDVLPLLHRIATVLDEPMGDSSCLPTWLVSQVAKQHVTVCLSGDGGDEMFGGYGRYFATLHDEARDRHFDAGASYYGSRMLIHLDQHLAELFGEVPPRAAALLASFRRRLSREPGPLLHRMRRHDAEHYMPGAVLAKVDRMSMQHSLEVRTPFLARELAAFAERMPVDALYGHGHGKLVLKELAQRWLPRAWLDRRKMGFGVPTLEGWGKADMVRWLQELLLGADSKLSAWIPRAGREAFAARMASDHGFAFYQAWLVLVLELWLRAHPARRVEPDEVPAVELRPLHSALQREPDAADFAVWAQLRALGGPALVFCDEELPAWLRHLPAGSVLVAPEPLEPPPGVRSVALDWRGRAAPDAATLFALPAATAMFVGDLDGVHADVLGMLGARGVPILHRAGAEWCMAHAVDNGAGTGTGTAPLSWRDRLRSRKLGSASTGIVQHVDGHCWRTVLPAALRARAAVPGARLIVSEDGAALPHPGSSVHAIAALGRGRYGQDGDFLYFAASDDTDPNGNGRDYRVVVRGGNGAARALLESPLGHLALRMRERVLRLLPVAERARTFKLSRPFRADGGACWLASLRTMRVPVQRLREGWTLAVLEDGAPLALPFSIHEDIRRLGRGRYSVWDEHVFFSSSDSSDPNRNGRSYTAEFVAPGAEVAEATAGGRNGAQRLQPALPTDGEFERAFAALAREPGRAPALQPGSAVVMLIGALYPGGSERQLCNLAVELDRRGLQVTILALAGLRDAATQHYRGLLSGTRVRLQAADRAHRAFACGDGGVDTQRLQLLASLPAGMREGVFRAFTHVAVLRPEVLHCSLDLPNVEGGIAGVLAAVPRIVLSVRSLNPTHYPNQYRPWFDRYYPLLAGSPRVRLLANSRAGADDYRQWLRAPDLPFHVVPNGLQTASLGWPDDDAVAAFRRGLGIPAGTPVAGALLRFSEEKRPLVLIDALAHAKCELPELHAVIAGVGAMQAEVEARLREHGLQPCVHLLGRRSDVALVHRAADVVLLTSRIEGLPNALLEAQWFERPVVATRAGGCSEAMVEGETGLLCDVDDSKALGHALAQLLRDPQRRQRMGEAGRAFVQRRFSLEQLVARTAALYGEAT